MNKPFPLLLSVTFLALAAGGCGPPPSPTATPVPSTATPLPPIELTSTAFGSGEMIPEKYTCDGEDISPPLAWGDPPPGTQSFALIVDNPDAKSVVGSTGYFTTCPPKPAACRRPSRQTLNFPTAAGMARPAKNGCAMLVPVPPSPSVTSSGFTP
jgi:hypothetical protein